MGWGRGFWKGVEFLLVLALVGPLQAMELDWKVSGAPRADSLNELRRAFSSDSGFRSRLEGRSLVHDHAMDSVFTYRAVLNFDGIDSSQMFLGIGAAAFPISVYWNGHRVFRWGLSDPWYNGASFQGEVVSLAGTLGRADHRNVVVLQMLPRGNNYSFPEIRVGGYRELGHFAFLRGLSNLVISGAGALASLVVCFLVFSLWTAFGRTRDDWAWFAHASFCIALSYTPTVLSSPVFPDRIFNALGQTGIVLSSLSILAVLVIHAGWRDLMRKASKWFIGAFMAITVSFFWTSSSAQASSRFAPFLFFLILPILWGGMILTIWSWWRRKATTDLVLTLGFSGLFLSSLHDVWFYLNNQEPVAWLFPIGFIFLELTMVSLIAMELWELWKQNQGREVELVKRKDELIQERIRSDDALRSGALFLEKMAHEFRTPMQGLMGMVDLLKTGGGAVDHEILSGTERQLKRHLVRINNVIDLMDLRYGTFQVRKERFDPDLLECVWKRFFSPRIDIASIFQDSDPVFAIGDPERLDRVVIAIGQILSEGLDDVVEVETNVRGNQLEVRLARRHSRAMHLKIRLFQYDNTPMDAVADVGELISAMGGRLDIDVDGDQLVCRIFIPVEPVVGNWNPERSHRLGEIKPFPLVLLAEDERINAKLVSTLLERAGCQVRWARNGQEAIDYAFLEIPDLVLMDIDMPIMNGIEAAKILRSDPRTSMVPIVVISAHAQEHVVLLSGVDAFLSKPVRATQLRQLIDQHCRISRQ